MRRLLEDALTWASLVVVICGPAALLLLAALWVDPS